MARKKKSSSKRGSRKRKPKPKPKRKKTQGKAREGTVGAPDPAGEIDSTGTVGESEPRAESPGSAIDTAPSESRDSAEPVEESAEPIEESAEPIEDLDAGLDEDFDSAAAAERLIRETLAIAGGDEDEDGGEPDAHLGETVVLDEDIDGEVHALDLDDEADVLDLDEELESAASADEGSARGEEAAEPEEEVLEHAVRLGDVSSPELRARLLAEAVADVEHREARYRVPLEESRVAGWKSIGAVFLLLVAGVVAVAPPGWARPAPAAELGPDIRSRGLRAALLLQAEQIEVFRLREQRLPTSLEEVPSVLPGVRYVRSGSRAYQLVAHERDGSAVVYDSAHPTPAFESAAPMWRPEEQER